MSKFMPQFLRLSDPSGTFIELFDLDGSLHYPTRLKHSTRAPGGFWDMTFDIGITDTEWEVWTGRLLHRMTIEAGALNTVWDGRIEDLKLIGQPGMLRVFCNGDWSMFSDATSNAGTYDHVYSAETADAIITDMITNGFHADTPAPTKDSNNFETGVSLTLTFTKDLTLWDILTDTSRGILSFPDSSDNKMDFLNYQDGFKYVKRDPTTPDWRTFILPPLNVPSFPLSFPWAPVNNAVDALYAGTSSSRDTTVTEDTASIAKYHRRELTIPDLGSTALAANAVDRAQGEITRHGDVQQQNTGFKITRVYDANGLEQPLCNVRAGDVIYITDWIPNGKGLGSISLDAARTFVIEGTECDHDNGLLTIVPDLDPNGLQQIFKINSIKAK